MEQIILIVFALSLIGIHTAIESRRGAGTH